MANRSYCALAIAAVILGPSVVTVRAADIDVGRLQALAQTVSRNDDQISAATLNDWIIKDRGDFRLIDLRAAADFSAGHIKGAVNIPLPRLIDAKELARLRAMPHVVVYAATSDQAAQAALLLRLAGVKALSLSGGFMAWAEQSLMPRESADGVQAREAARRAAVIRALNNCPRLPDAKIPPLQPAAAPAAPAASAAPTVLQPGPGGPPPGKGPAQKAPKQDVPIILEGGCG